MPKGGASRNDRFLDRNAVTMAQHPAFLAGSDPPLCYVEIAHLHRTCGPPQVQVSPPSVVRNDRRNVDFAAAVNLTRGPVDM
jgi:hypothetical protein